MWNPNPSEGLSCNSSFCRPIDPSPLGELVFYSLYFAALRSLKKSSSLLVGFTRKTLHFGSLCEEDTLVSWSVLFCCILCQKTEDDLDHILRRCESTRIG